jgi:hypothetical protein
MADVTQIMDAKIRGHFFYVSVLHMFVVMLRTAESICLRFCDCVHMLIDQAEIRRYLGPDRCKIWSGRHIFPAASPGEGINIDEFKHKSDEIRSNMS